MSRSPTLVFIYGPPAVGKLTVANALARRAPFRILHNHVTINAVSAVFEFGTPAFNRLVGSFRQQLLEAAAHEKIDVVFTYVFAPGDEPHVERFAAPSSAAEVVSSSCSWSLHGRRCSAGSVT